MVRTSFLALFFWHVIWLLRYGCGDAKTYTVEGIISLLMMAMVPSILFRGRRTAYHRDYEWWKASMLCAIIRSITFILGFYFDKSNVYGYGFGVMLIGLITLILLHKADKKSWPSTI